MRPACVARTENQASLADVLKKAAQIRTRQREEYILTASSEQLLERAARLESEADEWRAIAVDRGEGDLRSLRSVE
jgi:hypothetical protein